ncbi:MAG: carboxypeptidase-like regulatory domain-containing protein [bacterium]|nr:carboxypeptidase-like regulatory domain-containing protein [bacterium]
MKKIIITILVLILIIFLIQAAKVIYQTPVFTGRILDSISGRPIKDAVVTAVWWKSSKNGLSPFYSTTLVSGEKGEYSIPGCTRIHGSRLYLPDPNFYVSLGAIHPSYDGISSKSNPVWEEKNSQTGKIKFKGDRLPDGSIKYDILLDGLKEKFLLKFESTGMNRNETDRIVKTWDPDGFSTNLGNYLDGKYWKVLEKNNVPYNISETFSKWEALAGELDKMKKNSNSYAGKISYREKVYNARVEILTNLGL